MLMASTGVGEKPTFIGRVKGLTKQMNIMTSTEARLLSLNNGRASSQALRSIVYIENWSSYSTAFSIYYNGFPHRTLSWKTLLVRFILFHYAWYRSYKTECLCECLQSSLFTNWAGPHLLSRRQSAAGLKVTSSWGLFCPAQAPTCWCPSPAQRPGASVDLFPLSCSINIPGLR